MHEAFTVSFRAGTSRARAEEGGDTLDEAGAATCGLAEGSLDRARGWSPLARKIMGQRLRDYTFVSTSIPPWGSTNVFSVMGFLQFGQCAVSVSMIAG